MSGDASRNRVHEEAHKLQCSYCRAAPGKPCVSKPQHTYGKVRPLSTKGFTRVHLQRENDALRRMAERGEIPEEHRPDPANPRNPKKRPMPGDVLLDRRGADHYVERTVVAASGTTVTYNAKGKLASGGIRNGMARCSIATWRAWAMHADVLKFSGKPVKFAIALPADQTCVYLLSEWMTQDQKVNVTTKYADAALWSSKSAAADVIRALQDLGEKDAWVEDVVDEDYFRKQGETW